MAKRLTEQDVLTNCANLLLAAGAIVVAFRPIIGLESGLAINHTTISDLLLTSGALIHLSVRIPRWLVPSPSYRLSTAA